MGDPDVLLAALERVMFSMFESPSIMDSSTFLVQASGVRQVLRAAKNPATAS